MNTLWIVLGVLLVIGAGLLWLKLYGEGMSR